VSTSFHCRVGKTRPTIPGYGLGGSAEDAFRNAPARIGLGTPSLPEATEYPLVRWSNDYWLMITLFRNHWISRRIVEAPAQDMVRAWPKITSEITPDDIKALSRTLITTQTQARVLQAIKWARLYGGAGALIVIDGHENILDEPLDLDDVDPGSYRGLIVFDRWTGIYPEAEVSSDLSRPVDFGYPEYYRVSTANAQTFRVHCSRILRFSGPDVPAPEYQAQMYWGISVLEPAFEEIRKRDNLSWSILSLTFRAQILAQVNPELAQALSGLGMNQNALKAFGARMQAQNQLLSNQSMLILPKDGSLQSQSYSFGGLADVYQQYQLDISGAAEMPVSILFGRTLTGLGQSNDADLRIYEKRIAQEQQQDLRPQLEKLYPVICMSEFGEVPDDLDFQFPSVRVLTEEEKSALAKDGTAAVIEGYDAGLVSQKLSLKELKQQSENTGIWTNITDEDIEKASDEIQQPDELAPGMESPESVLGIPKREAAGEDSAPDHQEIEFAGLPLTVEYPKNTWRILRNPRGQVVYERFLENDYGFIRGTVGRDGDEVDVIVGPDESAQAAFVVNMIDLGPDVDQRQNEDKVCIGFQTADAARQAFLGMYPRSFFGGMKKVPVAGLRSRVGAVAIDEFKESDHPRVSSGEHGGEFTAGGGSKGASSSSGKASGQLTAAPDRSTWPEHIKALRIPPAWKDVRINSDADADLLAVGKDAKGRSQYVYSEKFQNTQAEAKFQRIRELDRKFSKIRAQNDSNTKSGDAKVRENAEVAWLVMSMGIRPGSDTDTKSAVKAYGATTLQGKHVVLSEGGVYLRFTGKKGVALNLKVTDPDVAGMLIEKAAAAGDDGPLFPGVTDKSLLDYTHTLNGGSFKTKDFRTLLGTRLALQKVSGLPSPKNMAQYKKAVKEVATVVSSSLGNTPTVALQSYINPVVFAGWRAAVEGASNAAA
jgi:phage-related protein (TIGR01555 family)